ncbi:hypothetical protein LY78DRAFT_269154 [Colletotrichum sublineola]|nr:hypothetical protein LY78DRAFT_269154 [Colletotrichum sublineola]
MRSRYNSKQDTHAHRLPRYRSETPRSGYTRTHSRPFSLSSPSLSLSLSCDSFLHLGCFLPRMHPYSTHAPTLIPRKQKSRPPSNPTTKQAVARQGFHASWGERVMGWFIDCARFAPLTLCGDKRVDRRISCLESKRQNSRGLGWASYPVPLTGCAESYTIAPLAHSSVRTKFHTAAFRRLGVVH